MADKQARVLVTCNAGDAKKVLLEFDQLIEQHTAHIQKLVAEGKANSAECKQEERILKALSQVQRDNIEDTKRLSAVIDDLANTKLRDLRRALGSGKSMLQGLTGSPEDIARAEKIREQMREVGNQLKLLEGQYVKLEEGMKDLDQQSDQWLNKAIKQQQELMSVTRRGTAEYESQKQVLAQLTQESERRSAKSPYAHTVDNAKAIANQDSIDLGNGQQHDVTKKDLEWSKNRLQSELNNTPLTDTAKVKELQDALANVDQRIKAINGDTQTAAMSSTKLNSVLGNMKTASLNDLKAASKELNKQLGELAPSSDAAKQVKKQLAELDKEIKQVEEDMVDVNDVIARSKNGKASLDELKKAYKQLGDEMNRLETGGKEFKEKQKALDQLKQKIDSATGAANKHASSWQTAMKNLTAYVGMFTVFNKAKELLTDVIKKNFEYSSSLTDIRKVSGMAMEDVNKLSNELAKIDTRTSIDGLAQLAYQGAKLGMGKYGVEGMAGFVRAADKINVAIGEEMGEDALPALSKLVETMGLIPKMGIEKAMDATGSAMFKLSSTSTATSGNIVEFAKRLTGVARTAGITTDQLLALGSASDSMYLMPEVASTAMSKFIVALQRNHNLIEKDLGIQQGTIKQMYAAGNAMDAIVLVLDKMKQTGNMNALGGIFKDLGSDGQRLVTAMVTMSKNIDMLKDHLYESKEAFEEASAITNEYTMQNRSAAGTLERANNLWEKAFVNTDGVNNVKQLADAWYSISNTILNSPMLNGSLHASVWVIIQSMRLLVYLLPAFINYLIALGALKAGRFFASIASATKQAVLAQTTLNAAVKVNPYVALASVIMTVVGLIWSFVSASQKASEAQAEAERRANAWKSRLGEAQQETDTLTKKLYAYKTALEQANLSQEQRNMQISKFNRDFRSYISKLGIEIKNVSDLKKHYSELSQEIQRATYYRMREKAKEDTMPAYQKDRLNAANRVRESLRKRADASKIARANGSNVTDDVWTQKMIMEQFARGTDANEIYRQIVKSRNPNVKDLRVDKRTGEYRYVDSKGEEKYRTGDQELLSALRHYQNATKREIDKDKEINDYFNAIVNLDGYHPWTDDELGTLDNEAPDKKALAEAKRQEREQAKAWRDELKQAKDDAQAVMDDVRNFYNRQVNEKLSEAVALGMDKTEQDLFVEPVKRRMNEALEQVRLAIAKKSNDWNDFKQSMNSDMLEKADETGVNLSQDLLDNIQQNNIAALAKKMEGLSAKLGKPYNSTVAEIFANATKNEQANLKLEAKQAEARRKVAAENDYTGAVKTNMYDDFNTMGYANPTKAEVTDKAAFDKRKQNIIDMFETARNGIAGIYAIDPTTAEGQGLLIKFLFGDDADGMGARIKSALGTNEADWQAFYNKLVQYSDQYTEAEKKTYDQAKKIAEQMWAVNERNLKSQRELADFQKDASLYGARTNFLSNLGLANNTVDPEVETMRLKMQMAEDYYYFVLQNSKNEQLIADAEKSRQDAELAYASQMATAMKSRLSQMQSLVNPIVDFGEAMGEAFAKMGEDAESANEAVKNAIKSMLQSWGKMLVNDVNTQMWKAINDAGVKRGKKNADKGIEDARAAGEAGATADAAARAANALGDSESNPVYVHVVNGIPEDANGNTVAAPLAPTGNVVKNPDGSQGLAPTGNNGGSFADEYMSKQNNGQSLAFKQTGAPGVAAGQQVAGSVGTAAADAISGGGSAAEIGASAASAAGSALLNTSFIGGRKSDKDEKKANKKEIKEAQKQQKELNGVAEKGAKKRTDINQSGIDDVTDATIKGGDEQVAATETYQNAANAAIDTAMNVRLTGQQTAAKEEVQTEGAKEQAKMPLSIAGAVGQCFSALGPIAGPIMAATVTAMLTGLLQWAISSAFGSSDSSSSSSTSTPNTKLKTGMLTYDSGNVQDLKPFVADNGDVYWATEDSLPGNGAKLLTSPTATTVNGRQSLVAENGPELVIGRETTKAMMMNNPSLLKALVNYDANYSGRRAYDQGNIAETIGNAMQTVQSSVGSAGNDAMLQAISALMVRLSEPIIAQINMYGKGNLYERMNEANQFMKGKR